MKTRSTTPSSVFGKNQDSASHKFVLVTGSNLFFNEDLSSVELPSPDIVSSLFLNDGENLQVGGCDISQY